MPQVEAPITISCVSNEVGGDLVGTAVWQGVPLADLLERAGVRRGPDAEQIVGRSVDGFTAGFPTAAALDGRTALVAVGMNGEPLPLEHGFPARLIVAGLYGYVSATKWLIEHRAARLGLRRLLDPAGWSKEGPIKTQSRIDVPRSGAELDAGPSPSPAWPGPRAGASAPSRSRSTTATGRRPSLGPEISDGTWRQWQWTWDADPGEPHAPGPGHRRHRRDPDLRRGAARARRRHRLAQPQGHGEGLTPAAAARVSRSRTATPTPRAGGGTHTSHETRRRSAWRSRP